MQASHRKVIIGWVLREWHRCWLVQRTWQQQCRPQQIALNTIQLTATTEGRSAACKRLLSNSVCARLWVCGLGVRTLRIHLPVFTCKLSTLVCPEAFSEQSNYICFLFSCQSSVPQPFKCICACVSCSRCIWDKKQLPSPHKEWQIGWLLLMEQSKLLSVELPIVVKAGVLHRLLFRHSAP